MTEEERFKKVYNIYMNYEAELATRGMDGIPPIAASLTNTYLMHEIVEVIKEFPNKEDHDNLLNCIRMITKTINEE